MKILFSAKADWQGAIVQGFQFTDHLLSFAPFDAEAIQAHDLVVPLSIDDLDVLDGMRPLIAGNPIPIPTRDVIRLCQDKLLLNQALIANGFGRHVPAMGNQQIYPFILKKRVDAFGQNTHLIHSPEQVDQLLATLPVDDYFQQELIVGPREHAMHILFKDGAIRCAIGVQYRFASDTPINGQNDKIDWRVGCCSHLDLFADILRSIGYEGLCCFDFKVVDGRPMIFEINPRFGASLCSHFFSFVEHLA